MTPEMNKDYNQIEIPKIAAELLMGAYFKIITPLWLMLLVRVSLIAIIGGLFLIKVPFSSIVIFYLVFVFIYLCLETWGLNLRRRQFRDGMMDRFGERML